MTVSSLITAMDSPGTFHLLMVLETRSSNAEVKHPSLIRVKPSAIVGLNVVSIFAYLECRV